MEFALVLLILISIIAGLVFVLAGYMLYRNEKVYKFRLDLIERLHDAAEVDIQNGRPWEWRSQTFETVSYKQMLYSRKPLTAEAWYVNTSFLQP